MKVMENCPASANLQQYNRSTGSCRLCLLEKWYIIYVWSKKRKPQWQMKEDLGTMFPLSNFFYLYLHISFCKLYHGWLWTSAIWNRLNLDYTFSYFSFICHTIMHWQKKVKSHNRIINPANCSHICTLYCTVYEPLPFSTLSYCALCMHSSFF